MDSGTIYVPSESFPQIQFNVNTTQLSESSAASTDS